MFHNMSRNMFRKASSSLERARLQVAPQNSGTNRAFATVALLALVAALPFVASAQKRAPANLTADLPPGPMQAKATSACLECHEARIILQQRLSKGAWAKEVDKMTKWGAVVDPADRDALIDYLSTNFNPDKPPYEPQRTTDKNGAEKSK